MPGAIGQDAQNVAKAAEALLREHPDALVAGLASNGLIVPVPHTVGLWGQGAIEGRAVFDGVVAGDRKTVAELWVRVQREGAVAGKVRMLNRPSTWVTLHFLDTLDVHGVLLCVILPSEEQAGEDGVVEEPVAAPPRFCSLMEDEGANVLECDDAFTEMFGYTAQELIGKSVLDQIHPDDQGRAVEGWLSVLSSRRAQQTRLRRRRKDGTWMWVDTTLHNYLNQPDRNHVLVEIIDASAEMSAQEALRDREELLRRLTDAMPVGLLHVDNDGSVLYSNARLLAILHGPGTADRDETAPTAAGSSGEQPAAATASPAATASAAASASARTLLGTVTKDGLTAFDSALADVLAEGIDRDIEVDIVVPSGAQRRALMSLRALLRQSGEVSGAIICVLDVTDSSLARRELERRATFDALTHCRNRSSILAAVEQELQRADSSTAAVVYIDLDEFKPINDKFGHAAGDELLTLVAERLRIASRGNDDVGRLGGDEFLVLLRDIQGSGTAMRVAHRIRRSLHEPYELSSGTVELGASIGVACAGAGSSTADELVKLSDWAMYCSKEQRLGTPVLAAFEGYDLAVVPSGEAVGR